MDIWVVAAAAGAGYIAQHWKDLLKSRHDFSESSLKSPSFLRTDSLPHMQQVLDNNCSSPVETPRKKLGECHDLEVASTSTLAGENLGMSCGSICDDINEPGYESLLPPSTTELAFSYGGNARKKSSLRSRRKIGHLIKPLNSLESCLMAQLYKEHGEVEDFIFTSNSSPWTPTARPFIVTDGSRIISRGTSNSLSTSRGAGHHKLQDSFSQLNTVFGVPQLPSVGSMELQGKAKVKDHSRRFSDFTKMNNERHGSLQGSSRGVLLFCLGISVGIISSFWKNRNEMDKLNELLRQSENLVQDLHEELEMKDSLTVEELAAEDCESQDTHNDSSNNGALHEPSPKGKLNKSSTNYDEDCQSQKTEEESMSKIEAELEAELERLELSMNSSKLEGKLAELDELDPGFVPDLAEGELRAELFSRQAKGQPYADQDGSATSTPRPVDYAVSPRELSLRLHEVLQSQLEERLKELEMALQNSERKVRYMEAELVSSWRDSSNSEGGSSSTHGSPVTKVEQRPADQPVVINLSGEALDAYNEAFDEFTRLNESEEEDIAVVSEVKDSNHQENSRSHERDFDWIENGRTNDESEDGDDEMEKLLIRHIVEKARKGSPAVLNVQRALFSLDDNEH
ncbi:uncharacterized protein LOC107823684 [Nicotiana tabacum]|uniref:Uncharacterized protein LOC107823684 n=1 Tax=Nicotiana tabacum TaxID=4097 RepID=A0A1S4CXJ5_TOBAC|nr:uncharacterized protein LOC104091408 [Nicotiana tomentosiformis]